MIEDLFNFYQQHLVSFREYTTGLFELICIDSEGEQVAFYGDSFNQCSNEAQQALNQPL